VRWGEAGEQRQIKVVFLRNHKKVRAKTELISKKDSWGNTKCRKEITICNRCVPSLRTLYKLDHDF